MFSVMIEVSAYIDFDKHIWFYMPSYHTIFNIKSIAQIFRLAFLTETFWNGADPTTTYFKKSKPSFQWKSKGSEHCTEETNEGKYEIEAHPQSASLYFSDRNLRFESTTYAFLCVSDPTSFRFSFQRHLWRNLLFFTLFINHSTASLW